MDKPPIPSPFENEKRDTVPLLKRKAIRIGLIVAAILLVLWIGAEITLQRVMYLNYGRYLPANGH